MTIQEELKEGIFKLLFPYAKPKPNDLVDAIFKFLDSKGVRVHIYDRKTEQYSVAVEGLIED